MPVELAGIAGPCPQCGGTIVAPLQPQVNQTAVMPEPAMAGASANVPPINSAPPVQQMTAPPIVTPPTVVEQPLQPAAHAAAPPMTPEPQVQPTQANPLPPFPMPLEQVSQTAAVALAQSPNQVPQPGPVMPAPAPDSIPMPETPLADASISQTQPIIVKKKSLDSPLAPAPLEQDLPQLDATLGAGNPGTLSPEALDQTIPIDDGYRPPNPTPLTPPADGLTADVVELGAEVEELPYEEDFELAPEVEAEFPLEEATPDLVDIASMPEAEIEEVPEAQDSMAAMLGEATTEEKSKDDILNELLGVAPAKMAKKKRGLSASSIAMLTILLLVAIGASIGVFMFGNKAGGWNYSKEEALGKEGLKNIDTRDKNFGAKAKVPATVDKAPKNLPPGELNETFKTLELTPEPKPKKAVKPKVEKPVVVKKPEETTPVGAVRPYNPLDVYAAPGPEDPPLTNTHEVVDAFLRSPDWQTRAKYSYQGESLKSTMAKYYQKNVHYRYNQFRPKIFQMELDPEYDGPFWVYQIFESGEEESGLPIVVRPENGDLKVDWKIYSEFRDRHFVKYTEEGASGLKSFHLIAERVIDYQGVDRPGFTEIDKYDCYKIFPPYGDYKANIQYAFVEKNSTVANGLKSLFTENSTALATVLTLGRESFSHGIKHYVIKDFQEGWLSK